MTCAWTELLAVLPEWMRPDVDGLGSSGLQELRLYRNAPPELVCADQCRYLERLVTAEDLHHILNAASRYSPWAAGTVAKGYLTIAGGHRIGLCGEAVVQGGKITGLRDISSLCIRVARDFPGISAALAALSGSVLILGPPGWGKTTLLRDLIRQKRETERIALVDERGELFPEGICDGSRIHVLTGCSKAEGIPMLLRTMGPSCIAVDEITEEADALALLQAANCGVKLLATAHARDVRDLRRRRLYRTIWEQGIFEDIVVLREDKSYRTERMREWVTNGSVRY